MTVAVALVGHGFMAATHADAYGTLGERVEVRYVVGRRRERAAELAARVGAEPIDRLEAVLADGEIAAVDVCVPTDAHRELAVPALEAGKHVLLEKPIALNLEDADAIAKAAEASSAHLMVGLVLRFWPEYVALQRLVSEGRIGTPQVFASTRLSPPADWNTWMADVARSGGVVIDLLPHDIDQALTLLGQARTVSARSVAEGAHAVLTVEHEAGGVSIIEGSMAMPRSFPFSSSARVDGSSGTAEYAFRVGAAEEGGNLGEAAGPGGLQVFVGTDEVQRIEAPAADPFTAEIDAFVMSIEEGRQPTAGTATQARAALAVSLAAARSIANGGRPEPVA
jgi:predicted dehydrogenase